MIQNRAIVTVERQIEVVCDLLNGVIFSELVWHVCGVGVFRRTPTDWPRKCVSYQNVIVSWSFNLITWNCCMTNN